jgi:flagellar hook-associated protein 2
MPVTLSGLASGIDTQSIVNSLISADSGNLNNLQRKSSQTADASSTVSAVGTSLSTLSTAALALADASANGSFTATSSSTSIAVTTTSSAQPGTYSVKVNALAAAQRTYSASFASDSTALGQTGSFSIGVGTGTATNINVTATDSLQSIASKINNAGLQVAASIFNDGKTSRLQIRGLSTGEANGLTFTETGTTLDLNGTGTTPTSGNTVQKAQDASLTIDNFLVTRPTNQITGAVNGLSLTVTDITAAPVAISVASDSSGLSTKLNAVVTAYNDIIGKIHKATGYGDQKAANPLLSADATLRTVGTKLAASMQATSTQSGSLTSLADIGLTLQRDGTLALDSSKLTTKFSTDPLSVQKLLGRLHSATTGGLLANLNDTLTTLTSSSGVLANKTNSYTSQKKLTDDAVTREQDRLDKYRTQLQAQFSAMETAYSQNQSLLTQVQKL